MQHEAETVSHSQDTKTNEIPFDDGIGLKLRARRLELNYSLQDIAALTKIQTGFIEALEEERFDQLPGRVYVVGFLKTYTQVLGLEPSVIDAYFSHPRDTAETKQNYKVYLPRENKNFLSVPVVVIALLLLIAGAFVLYAIKNLLNESDAVPLTLEVPTVTLPVESGDGGADSMSVENEDEFLATDDDVDLHIGDDVDPLMQGRDNDGTLIED